MGATDEIDFCQYLALQIQGEPASVPTAFSDGDWSSLELARTTPKAATSSLLSTLQILSHSRFRRLRPPRAKAETQNQMEPPRRFFRPSLAGAPVALPE